MEHSGQPLISIVIPTTGTESLRACLDACRTAGGDFSVEILVVIDALGKTDETLAAEFPTVRFLQARKAGVAHARNTGLAEARGRFFLLIDDDCLPEAALFSALRERSFAGHLHGGRYLLEEPHSYWARVYHWTNDRWLDLGELADGSNSHLLGGFLFGEAALLPRMKFDPRLFWGGEEKDLVLRLKGEGIPARLHRDLAIVHRDRSGFLNLIRRAFRQGVVAGSRRMASPSPWRRLRIPAELVPGLAVFYCFSRIGIFVGKLKR